ncbi:MAG: hypothetical protein MI810_16510 [Flavobacteriales bacterium]|nr:hypothetical protein [Flavobacteriales bacterium]
MRTLIPFFLVLLISCSENTTEDSSNSINLDSVETETDSLAIVVEEVDSNLIRLGVLLDNPLDFSKVKEDFRMLEMGRILPEEYMHPIDSNYHNYNYGAVAAILRQTPTRQQFQPSFEEMESMGRVVSFSTYKPWSSSTDKYYENDNEILVGFETAVSHPSLEPSNFVGKNKNIIESEYGTPHAQKDDCLIYFHQHKILVLHQGDEIIDWIKYYWLADHIESIDDLPLELYSWRQSY